MRSILLSSSNSAQGGGRAQPDACQCCLAGQSEPVKGERSEFILTLDGSGRFNRCFKQRQCLIVSYQPTGRRLSWLHELHLRPVLTTDSLGRIFQVFVGEMLGGEECYSSRGGCGKYLINVPKAPKNESLLVRGAFIATRI